MGEAGNGGRLGVQFGYIQSGVPTGYGSGENSPIGMHVTRASV